MGLVMLSYTRTPTKSLQAAGRRPSSCCCNVDLKAVPSIDTCRYCSAAMQTVLCGLLLVDFIITHSWLWMAPSLCNIYCHALCVLPSDFSSGFVTFLAGSVYKVGNELSLPFSKRCSRHECCSCIVFPELCSHWKHEQYVNLFLSLRENSRSSWPVNSRI